MPATEPMDSTADALSPTGIIAARAPAPAPVDAPKPAVLASAVADVAVNVPGLATTDVAIANVIAADAAAPNSATATVDGVSATLHAKRKRGEDSKVEDRRERKRNKLSEVMMAHADADTTTSSSSSSSDSDSDDASSSDDDDDAGDERDAPSTVNADNSDNKMQDTKGTHGAADMCVLVNEEIRKGSQTVPNEYARTTRTSQVVVVDERLPGEEEDDDDVCAEPEDASPVDRKAHDKLMAKGMKPTELQCDLVSQLVPKLSLDRLMDLDGKYRCDKAPPLICCLRTLSRAQPELGAAWFEQLLGRIKEPALRDAVRRLTLEQGVAGMRDVWWSKKMTKHWITKSPAANVAILLKWAGEDSAGVTCTAQNPFVVPPPATARTHAAGPVDNVRPPPEKKQELQQDAPPPPPPRITKADMRPDVSLIEKWYDEHNHDHDVARLLKKRNKAKDKTKRDKYDRQLAHLIGKLDRKVVLYLNRWWGKVVLATQPHVVMRYGSQMVDAMGIETGDIEFKFHTLSLKAFADAHAHFKVKSKGSLAHMWLEHRDCRRFDVSEFHPRPEGYKDTREHQNFNSWQGMRITRTAAHAFVQTEAVRRGLGQSAADLRALSKELVQPWIDHVRDIWCCGEESHALYVIKWSAHVIQMPWKKTKVAVVLQGTEGSGKGIGVGKLGEIIGTAQNHFFPVHNIHDVLGTYTNNIRTALLCFVDEAVWGGEKEAAGLLKKLVTEPTMQHHQKYQDSFLVNSFINMIFASNEEWVIHAGTQERRVFALRTSSKYAGPQTPESKAYFDRLAAVPAEALAHYLYNIDLADFNPTAIECTAAQREQKRKSLDPLHAWWNSCLESGQMDGTRAVCRQYLRDNQAPVVVGDEAPAQPGMVADVVDVEAAARAAADAHADDDQCWVSMIYKSSVHESYERYCRQINSHAQRVNDSALWCKLLEWANLADAPGAEGFIAEIKKKDPQAPNCARRRCVRFPSLERCRDAWRIKMRDPDWFAPLPPRA